MGILTGPHDIESAYDQESCVLGSLETGIAVPTRPHGLLFWCVMYRIYNLDEQSLTTVVRSGYNEVPVGRSFDTPALHITQREKGTETRYFGWFDESH